ncbi:MAG: acetyl-CoA carboxylase biotin carboxyl carrier protein [Planctomycetales bacterium]|nr:acetyl-CoA carboxylase biotin carboxyl carrier protein [Planctomycetales bacterium]
MSDQESHSSENKIDFAQLHQLAELMKEHDLAEVYLRDDDRRIRLRRGVQAELAVSRPAAPVAAAAPAPVAAKEESSSIVTINSPMVGTFYSAANPDSPPFVKVGDHVSSDSIVCIIEAMKVFNEIPADVSGKIVAVLVDNEEAVDVNKPLFKVDTGK